VPSFRKPKGVRALSTGDRFYANIASASGVVAAVGGKDGQVSLYNDAQLGEWFFVYSISPISGLGLLAYYFQVAGTSGANQGGAFPIVSGNPTPLGQIYTANVAQIVPGPGVTFPFLQEFSQSGGNWQAAPLAVVKPGYSLIVQSAGDLECTFGYVVIGN